MSISTEQQQTAVTKKHIGSKGGEIEIQEKNSTGSVRFGVRPRLLGYVPREAMGIPWGAG
jgi:hypothetical protein